MGYVKTGKATVMTGSVVRRTFAEIMSRGKDASGYGVVSKDRMTVYKKPITSAEMAGTKRFRQALSVGRIIIGHSRAATNGSPKKNRNNHPFWTEDGRYVLIHNGVIRDNPEHLEIKSECDSEIALRMIEKHGVREAFERMAIWRDSDYAILVIDTKNGVVHLSRNDGRPAHFINARSVIGGYLIASTREIIKNSLRHGGVIQPGSKIIEVLPWSIYTFRPGVSDITPLRLSCYDEKIQEEKDRLRIRMARYPMLRKGKYYHGWSGGSQAGMLL